MPIAFDYALIVTDRQMVFRAALSAAIKFIFASVLVFLQISGNLNA
jgi:hypothetical protein